MKLSQEEIRRYSRHIVLPEVGLEGQEKLLATKVLLIGAGGLGSPLAMYLTAAGVGTIGMVDFDEVEISNLQRQILHYHTDIGKTKLKSAEETLKQMNPNLNFIAHETTLRSDNALEIIGNYDYVVDGTDNFPTRYLVNDASVMLNKPNIYGSIYRFDGQATVFMPYEGPCYRCLYPEPPPPGLIPSCEEGGVIGVLPGIIALIQATEVIKLTIGQGRSLVGRLLLYDAMEMSFQELEIERNPECVLCGKNPTIRSLIDYDEFCGIRPSADIPNAEIEVTVQKASEKWKEPNKNRVLLDVREPFEYDIVHIEGSTLIPLGELPSRVKDLDMSKEYLLLCKLGGRSMQATQLLKDLDFPNVKNIHGGIIAWAKEIDSSLPTY